MRIKKYIVVIVVLFVCVALVTLRKESPEKENNIENIAIGDGLVLNRMCNETGVFVEDGSDQKVEEIATIAVHNQSEKSLQLANIYVELDGEVYSFQITTLPAGEVLMAQELEKKSFPEKHDVIEVSTEHVVFFQEEPSIHSELFELELEDSEITLKNISEQKINGPIYVYYKQLSDDGYMGGITYRVSFSELNPGESQRTNAGHFQKETYKVMFINYAP